MAGEDQQPLAPASDVGSSMLSAAFVLSGKMHGLPSPLTAAEVAQLERDLEEGRP